MKRAAMRRGTALSTSFRMAREYGFEVATIFVVVSGNFTHTHDSFCILVSFKIFLS